VGRFQECFAELRDPRTGNRRRHDLLEVVFIALCASLCGAESCVDMADFGQNGVGVNFLKNLLRPHFLANFRDPTEHEMISMSLLCALMGAKGFVYYSYSDLSGHISPTAKPDFERRWPEVCRMAGVMQSLAPFILAEQSGPHVAVTVEAGTVLAKGFTDSGGRVRVLVTGIGPGESRALLTVTPKTPLRSQFGNCTALGAHQYRFRGTDICSDILASK